MKNYIVTALIVIVVVTLSILGFVFNGINLNDVQKETLIILLIICGSSALYCFVVGEIAHNNSQMDKLWSVLPVVYVWVIAAKGGMDARLIVYAVIVTLWGIRLTFNFARKGAYSIRFWEGEEDYRWAILRKNKLFQSRIVWALFNFFFISIYQNFLVLVMCFPALGCIGSTVPFGVFDYIAAVSAMMFLILETVADEEQWVFQQKKKKMLGEGRKLEELDEPYNLGFNTFGLWNVMRHPNYLGEQAIWVCLYFFVIGSGNVTYGVFSWTLFGPMLIILLFLGSSTLGEAISSSKYPLYKDYTTKVFKYLPFRRYRKQSIKKEA